jgi:STE24 endopeptidase
MISRVHRACALLILLLCLTAGSVSAQTPARGNAVNEMPSVTTVPPAAQPSSHFDVDAATEAYLAQIPAGASARSDAYFEGGYWLILWDFIYGAAISLLLLNLRWSARMRDLAERLTRFRPLRTFVYWTQYSVVTFLLGAPLAIYEGYTRERRYGLATQTFGPWAWDQTKGMLLGIVLGGLLVMALFGIVRRLPKTWWIWGSAVTMMFLLVAVLIGPIYLQPLFNKVAPLADPKVTEPILSLARANGILRHRIDRSTRVARIRPAPLG